MSKEGRFHHLSMRAFVDLCVFGYKCGVILEEKVVWNLILGKLSELSRHDFAEEKVYNEYMFFLHDLRCLVVEETKTIMANDEKVGFWLIKCLI